MAHRRPFDRPASSHDFEACEAVTNFVAWCVDRSNAPRTEPIRGLTVGDVAVKAMALYQAGIADGRRREQLKKLGGDGNDELD